MLLSRLRRAAPPAPQIRPTRLHAAAGLLIRGMVEARPEVSDVDRIHHLLWIVQILHVAWKGYLAFPNVAVASGAGNRVLSLHKLLKQDGGIAEILDPVHLEMSDEALEQVVRVVIQRHVHQTTNEIRDIVQRHKGVWWTRYVTHGMGDTEISRSEIVREAAMIYGQGSTLDASGKPRAEAADAQA